MTEFIIRHPSGMASVDIGNEVISIGSAVGPDSCCKDLQRAICVIQVNDLRSANAARNLYVQVAITKKILGEAQAILDGMREDEAEVLPLTEGLPAHELQEAITNAFWEFALLNGAFTGLLCFVGEMALRWGGYVIVRVVLFYVIFQSGRLVETGR